MLWRRNPSPPPATTEWLIVGLGNPGGEYRGTRHNVGFDAIDLLADRHRIRINRGKHRGLVGIGTIAGHAVVLVKPTTYMNLSGRAVAPLAREYGLKPERVFVIADDKDLDCGRLRLKLKGSAGGHNGHKSLIESLGTQEYPRIKIGIGSGRRGEAIDHVLGNFNREERIEVDRAIEATADAVEALAKDGLQAALKVVEDFNRPS